MGTKLSSQKAKTPRDLPTWSPEGKSGLMCLHDCTKRLPAEQETHTHTAWLEMVLGVTYLSQDKATYKTRSTPHLYNMTNQLEDVSTIRKIKYGARFVALTVASHEKNGEQRAIDVKNWTLIGNRWEAMRCAVERGGWTRQTRHVHTITAGLLHTSTRSSPLLAGRIKFITRTETFPVQRSLPNVLCPIVCTTTLSGTTAGS
ncbi:hypothetical protein J6590_028024 [Homalodisca vitripennis]|nr:hypothetical protein J6590_028024 [Homalodisca vitripennis]